MCFTVEYYKLQLLEFTPVRYTILNMHLFCDATLSGSICNSGTCLAQLYVFISDKAVWRLAILLKDFCVGLLYPRKCPDVFLSFLVRQTKVLMQLSNNALFQRC